MKPVPLGVVAINIASPSARGRGLKHEQSPVYRASRASPPARGRGLKLWIGLMHLMVGLVAPRAGAWIETASIVNLCVQP